MTELESIELLISEHCRLEDQDRDCSGCIRCRLAGGTSLDQLAFSSAHATAIHQLFTCSGLQFRSRVHGLRDVQASPLQSPHAAAICNEHCQASTHRTEQVTPRNSLRQSLHHFLVDVQCSESIVARTEWSVIPIAIGQVGNFIGSNLFCCFQPCSFSQLVFESQGILISCLVFTAHVSFQLGDLSMLLLCILL